MPKENKSTGRRSRRQCAKSDNEIASGAREPLKPVTGSNHRYSPFPKEGTKKEARETKGNMIVPSAEGLHSVSGGIIENGIKYIMFPLHLLRFCIFGASVSSSADRKDDREAKRAERSDKDGKESKEARRERKEEDSVKKTKDGGSSRKDESSGGSSDRVREDRNASPRKRDTKEKRNDGGGETSDEMVTAEEDSDSSGEQWCTASNTMMVLDHENIDRSMSYARLEEPMDISMEEHTYDKTHSAIRISHDSRRSASVQNNVDGNICLKYIDEQDGNSSVDDEISRIFQKQCTSSEDEFPPRSYSKSFSSCKYERTKQSNYLSRGVKSKYSPVIPRSKKGLQDDERDRKKKTSEKTVDVFANSKRRKVSGEEMKSERREERKSESKTREDKRSSRQDTSSSKYKSHSSRTPVKSRDSKRKDIKYKEMATQTDSAFSDEDVEMIPIDAKTSEKILYGKYGTHKSHLHPLQGKEEQESNYVADNEDSTDGFLRIAHKRISSGSTSSSSTDLGFDERVSATSDTDIAVGLWRANSADSKSHFRTGARAPPGFPQIPQNPPLTSYVYNDSNHFMLTSLKNINDLNRSLIETVAAVPPAPSPMRHLYYDYPEFMDLPAYVNTSKILNNILKNNYNR